MKTTFLITKTLISLFFGILQSGTLFAEHHTLHAACVSGRVCVEWDPDNPIRWNQVDRLRLLVGNTSCRELKSHTHRLRAQIEGNHALELGVDGVKWYPVITGKENDSMAMQAAIGGVSKKPFWRVGTIRLPSKEEDWKATLRSYDTLVIYLAPEYPGADLVAKLKELAEAGKKYTTLIDDASSIHPPQDKREEDN